MNIQDIHIYWEGPSTLNDIKLLKNENQDYGIYQVYGHHPLYGNDVLLYIGRAKKRTFGERLPEEGWEFDYDPKNTQIYIGLIAGHDKINNKKWELMIELAEKLLIYSHNPIYNTSNTVTIDREALKDVRVYNWNTHRDLLPEVSGFRQTSNLDFISKNNIYSLDKGNVKA